MITEIQLTEIRNYLLAKKLPIDILIEVNDHFVSQILDIQREENLGFEEAFEKVKDNWKEELRVVYPWYVLNKTDYVEQTIFEKKIKQQNDKEIIKTSIYVTLFVIFIYFISLFQLDYSKFKIIHRLLIIFIGAFGILPVFTNLIMNRFMYTEKYKNYKFSVFQWRTIASFSIVYFILLYVKPIDTVFKNIHVLHFSIENILKIILFFSAFSILIYTGIYHFKLIKTVKKVKYFIKYL
jgi:hypothetical protein